VLITDTEFAPVVGKAPRQLDRKPLVIDIDDMARPGVTGTATWNMRRFAPPATRGSQK
jgi:hypothetical protein